MLKYSPSKLPQYRYCILLRFDAYELYANQRGKKRMKEQQTKKKHIKILTLRVSLPFWFALTVFFLDSNSQQCGKSALFIVWIFVDEFIHSTHWIGTLSMNRL